MAGIHGIMEPEPGEYGEWFSAVWGGRGYPGESLIGTRDPGNAVRMPPTRGPLLLYQVWPVWAAGVSVSPVPLSANFRNFPQIPHSRLRVLPGILLRQFGFLLRVFASGVSASPRRAASRSTWPCDAAPSRDAVQERRRRAVLRLRSNREHAVVLPGFLLFDFGFLLWNSCFTMVSVLEILEAGRCRQEHRRRAVLRLGSNREQ